MFYLIKRRKLEILHRRALNYPNRDEGEQCGDDGLLIHILLLHYNHNFSIAVPTTTSFYDF